MKSNIDVTYGGQIKALKNLKPMKMEVNYTVEGKSGETTTTSFLINADNKDFLMITFNYQELKKLIEEEISRLNKEKMNSNVVIRNEKPIRIDTQGLDYMVNLEQNVYKAIDYMEEALECKYHGSNLSFDDLIHNTVNILKGANKE